MITPLGSLVVSTSDNPPSTPGRPTDDELLAAHAAVLADGVERALPLWVVRCVVEVADAWQPGLSRSLAEPAAEAGRRAAAEVGPEVRSLLEQDVDDQVTGPLAVLRTAVRYPTAVLAGAGVGAVVRDEFAERAFPDDVYGLAPASFADLHPALHEPGLVWGAAKAHVVLARRRADGHR
jgi:hypothetical protein